MKSRFVPLANSTAKKWYLIDAKDKTLGRVSTLIAQIVSGKHKSTYLPYLNCGDCVVVINAQDVVVTGKKGIQKLYRNHSGRPGGLKIENFGTLQARIPERVLEKSVRGMLPKGALGRDLYRNLKVYKGDTHPHLSQTPELLI
jgi:large subunit ribosomal protein L13|tara:strand:+ start:475 stop:903 length:429 start_codon:yes stop_codon:yes gene_type:complete